MKWDIDFTKGFNADSFTINGWHVIPTTIAIIVIIIIIILVLNSKSRFDSSNENINEDYDSVGCVRDNRNFPQGKLPGSYLGLNDASKMNLFPSFYKNSSINSS